MNNDTLLFVKGWGWLVVLAYTLIVFALGYMVGA